MMRSYYRHHYFICKAVIISEIESSFLRIESKLNEYKYKKIDTRMFTFFFFRLVIACYLLGRI